jgi:4-hydroxy-tetrahydrodipicolinate reductase
MNFLILGQGKTGSIVADLARQRKHQFEVLGAAENARAQALTPEKLEAVSVVIDFTTPEGALENMKACIRAGKNMVVGTTGWYDDLPAIRALVQERETGFLYGSNFSIGINLFLDAARAAAAALQHGYTGQIFERHHVHKKDAPSGTALMLQSAMASVSGVDLEITSFREGEVVGMHEVVLDCANDNIYLCHDAKSRRGFAEGAIRAAEWLAGRHGFYEFKDVWREL